MGITFIWWRKHAEKLHLFSLSIFSAFFYLRNLKEALPLLPDEVRAFVLMPSGPMIYALCFPLVSFFKRIDAAFYLAGALGMFSVLLFYFVVRKISNSQISFYAALIYCFLPLRIHFSRTLLPVVFAEFFLLVLILALLHVHDKDKPYLYAVPGFFAAILFLIHPFTYGMLFGAALTFLSAKLWASDLKISRKTLTSYLICITSFIAILVLFQIVVRRVDANYIFADELSGFRQEVLSGIERDGNNLYIFMRRLWQSIIGSAINFLAALFFCGSILFALVKAVAEKNKPLLFSLIFFFSATGLFLISSLAGMHETRDRHMVWVTMFFSFWGGYLFYTFVNGKNKTAKFIVSAVFAAYIVTSTINSYAITTEMFTAEDIKNWLSKNQIDHASILSFINLHDPGSSRSSAQFPCRYIEETRTQVIHWPPILAAYRRGFAKYIIPYGPGNLIYIGEGDIMLERVAPLRSWPSPYWEFENRFPRNRNTPHVPINIYSLEDIFTEDNISYGARGGNVRFDGKNWKAIERYSQERSIADNIKRSYVSIIYDAMVFSGRLKISPMAPDLEKIIKNIDDLYSLEDNVEIPLTTAVQKIFSERGPSFLEKDYTPLTKYTWSEIDNLRLWHRTRERIKNSVINLALDLLSSQEYQDEDQRRFIPMYHIYVDEFYENSDNADIPVFFAVETASLSRRGASNADIETYMNTIRRNLAAIGIQIVPSDKN